MSFDELKPRRVKAYLYLFVAAIWLAIHFFTHFGLGYYSRPPLNPTVAHVLGVTLFYASIFGWIFPLALGLWMLLRRN
jgi:hypothetical protein